MKSISGLYRPYYALATQPVIYQHYYPDYDYTLEVRPFSILNDIAVIHEWIARPRTFYAANMEVKKRPLLKYYKTILESADAQAFMILNDFKPVCQIDIVRAQTEPVHSRFARNTHDVSLRYVTDYRITADSFRNSIDICVRYLFSFDANITIYISQPATGLLYGNLFLDMGFRYVDTHIENDQRIEVYACAKADHASIPEGI